MTIEEIKEKICDEYCRFPRDDRFFDISDICENCPLNLIGDDNGRVDKTTQMPLG